YRHAQDRPKPSDTQFVGCGRLSSPAARGLAPRPSSGLDLNSPTKHLFRNQEIFSGFPSTIFMIFERTCPVSALIRFIVSPSLLTREQGPGGCSFHTLHTALPFMVHWPCHTGPLAVLYIYVPSAA